MVSRKRKSKEPVLVVFVVLIIGFFMFNSCKILFEVNTYSGEATGIVKKVESIEAKQHHRTGYKITVDYEFEGTEYKNKEITYFPKLKKYKGQVGDSIDINVNKNDHSEAMYDIWGDNERLILLISSILIMIAIIWASVKLSKIMA